jgi:hypothetical protein
MYDARTYTLLPLRDYDSRTLGGPHKVRLRESPLGVAGFAIEHTSEVAKGCFGSFFATTTRSSGSPRARKFWAMVPHRNPPMAGLGANWMQEAERLGRIRV